MRNKSFLVVAQKTIIYALAVRLCIGGGGGGNGGGGNGSGGDGGSCLSGNGRSVRKCSL